MFSGQVYFCCNGGMLVFWLKIETAIVRLVTKFKYLRLVVTGIRKTANEAVVLGDLKRGLIQTVCFRAGGSVLCAGHCRERQWSEPTCVQSGEPAR